MEKKKFRFFFSYIQKEETGQQITCSGEKDYGATKPLPPSKLKRLVRAIGRRLFDTPEDIQITGHKEYGDGK